jgi:signal transduction histidine kinase
MLYIKQVFQPVQELNQSIRSLTISNLNQFVPVKEKSDELGEIARNYNAMLRRLYTAVESQKAFVHNASHELKTPLARISLRIENLLASEKEIDRNDLEGIGSDLSMLSETVESLLLLHQLQEGKSFGVRSNRLDELLYACLEEIKAISPNFHPRVDIDSAISDEKQLIVMGNPILLRICMMNLLKNASRYSKDDTVEILMKADPNSLTLSFKNPGDEPLDANQIFEPFYRGDNARLVEGTGLGLSIVKRITAVMEISVYYAFEANHHSFNLTFKR